MNPELSVLLITPDRFEPLRNTLGHLGAQTAARDRLEIVLVAPSRAELRLTAEDEAALDGFPRWQLVEVGPGKNSAEARAAGVRAASAPVVAFTEDHSYPSPGWAAALIEAHRGPWAAVGPAFENPNPDTAVSWANLLIEYGPWTAPQPRGAVDHLAPHNSSYKRDLLLTYGDALEQKLEAETVIFWELRAGGHQLLLEPAAVVRHVNFSDLRKSVALRLAVGQIFAGNRAQGWPAWKRALYALASPLIPLVRLRRLLPVARRVPGVFPRVLPALVGGLLLDGFGELRGYLFGPGGASRASSDFEFHRAGNLSARDRALLYP